MAKSRAPDEHILEEGDIFFLYRPKVNENEPAGMDDVQRFEMVMRPRGGDNLRVMVIGKKRLPDISDHGREWGFVESVKSSGKKLEKDTRAETRETETRGEQENPAYRPAGEGVYAVSLEDGQMHLSFALELPDEPDDVQKALRIPPEASYALSVKNPEKGQPANAGLSEDDKADYPERLQEKFDDRRFAAETLELLDYEGAEFVLVGSRTNPQSEYDVDLDADEEDYDSADTIRYLHMVKSRHPVEPLFEGEWA